MASLTMSIAIRLFSASNEDYENNFEKEKQRANCIRWTVNITFYTLTATWFMISAITGSILWRLGINVLFFF